MEKRVGVYLRVSTLGQNTDPQRFEIESFLKARGWNNFEVYEDKLSGTTNNRPALNRLLGDARARRLDVVVCLKLDRFFRSLNHLVSTLQELNDLGVRFIAVKDQIDQTTAAGRLMTHLLASFAEFESEIIRERVIAGIRNAQRRGVRLGRPPTVNATDIRLLREKGLSLGQISRRLGVSKTAVHKSLKQIVPKVVPKDGND